MSSSAEPQKRKLSSQPSEALVAKRQRREDDAATSAMAIIKAKHEERTSGLKAPIMLLSGHGAAVTTGEFDPTGQHLATGSFDKSILLWNVYGECENYAVLTGHKNAVLELHWSSDSSMIFSCSADQTVAVWDTESMSRVKRFSGHDSFVNSVAPTTKGPQLLASAADDGTVMLWDLRSKTAVKTFANRYQMTAVAISAEGERVYAGGLDNEIKVWDMRKEEQLFTLEAHTDTVTGVSLSPDGAYLLSNGMDNRLLCWDVRPFVAGSRCIKSFEGAVHSFEKSLLKCNWSPNGMRVACGSADNMVDIWEFADCKLSYRLPGHAGSVNQVVFHPTEPIVASMSSDTQIYMGEIRE